MRARHAVGLDAARPDAVERRRRTGQRTARENVDDLLDPGSARRVRAAGDRRPAPSARAPGPHRAHARRRAGRRHRHGRRPARRGDVLRLHGPGRHPGPAEPPEEGPALRGGRAPAAARGVLHRGRRRPPGRHRRHRRVRPRLPRLQPVRPPLRARPAGRASRAAAASPATPPSSGAATSSSPPRARNIGMGGPAMVEGGGLGVFPPEAIGPMDVQVPNGVVDVAVRRRGRGRRRWPGSTSPTSRGPSRSGRRRTPTSPRAVIPENRLHGLRRARGRRRHRRRRLACSSCGPPSASAWSPRWSASRDARWAWSPTTRCTWPAPSTPTAPTRRPASCSSATPSTCRSSSCATRPGIMVGPDAEQTALVRHVSRLFVTGANVTVPTGTIILRKGYGLGAQAMAGGSFKAPLFCVAWPTGELGGMGLEGAVRLGYRKELDAIEDAGGARADLPGDGRPHVHARQGGQRRQPLRDRRRHRPRRLPPVDQHDLRRRAATRRAERARSARTSTPGDAVGTGRLARDAALDRQGRRRHHRPPLRRTGAQGRRRGSRPWAAPTRPRPPSGWPGPRSAAARSSTSILTARRARPLGAHGRGGHRAPRTAASSSRARRSCPPRMVRGGRGRSSTTSAAASSCRRSSSSRARTAPRRSSTWPAPSVRRAERAAVPVAAAGSQVAALPQPPVVAAVDPRPLGRGRAAAHPHHADPLSLNHGGPLVPHHRARPHRSRRRGGLGRRRRRRPDRGRRASTGATWPVSGFEGKKGDVRAVPGAGRRHHLRRRAGARGGGRRRTCCARPPDPLARAAKRLAVARRRPARRRSRRPTMRPARRRRSPRASCSAATSSRRSSPSRSRSKLERDRDRRGWRASGSQAAIDRGRGHRGGGVLGARPGERARRLAHARRSSPSRRWPRGLGPASRSRCGTRRRSGSRSSAACSA